MKTRKGLAKTRNPVRRMTTTRGGEGEDWSHQITQRNPENWSGALRWISRLCGATCCNNSEEGACLAAVPFQNAGK